MNVYICGIPHEVVEVEESVFAGSDLNLGQINFNKCQIYINKNIPPQLKDLTLCHEMVHGILTHIGRDDLSTDEWLVTSIGNALYQTLGLSWAWEEGKGDKER